MIRKYKFLERDYTVKQFSDDFGISTDMLRFNLRLGRDLIEILKHSLGTNRIFRDGKNPPSFQENKKRKIQRYQLKLKESQKIAAERGGKCLSKKYFGTRVKLKFKCHVDEHPPFRSLPFNIKIGQWCSYCSGYKSTIEDMQIVAKEHGGKCLSKKYVNQRIKLRWECEHGHQWEATPIRVVKKNSWCHTCGRSSNLNCSSKYTGVTRRPGNTWDAKIIKGGKKFYLGRFDSEKDAALAFNKKSRELYGKRDAFQNEIVRPSKNS